MSDIPEPNFKHLIDKKPDGFQIEIDGIGIAFLLTLVHNDCHGFGGSVMVRREDTGDTWEIPFHGNKHAGSNGNGNGFATVHEIQHRGKD